MYVKFVHSELQSLGIEYLASALKERNHRVGLVVDPSFSFLRYPAGFAKFILNYRKKIVRMVLSGNPGIIAFSVNVYNMGWACDLAAELKKLTSAKIVFGGIQATFMPEMVLKRSHADFIILGEGEEALCELVDGIAKGTLDLEMENLCFYSAGQLVKNPLRNLEPDLDKFAYPQKDLLPYWFNKGLYRIIVGRGCAGSCSYCCAPLQRQMYKGKGTFVRRRSIGNVLDELARAKSRYGMRRVFFEDDIFTCDLAWLGEFQKRYTKEIALPCFVHATPASISEEVAAMLKNMMCAHVEIGVQSLNEATRKNILNRNDTMQEIEGAVRVLKRHGISCICDTIVNLPGETDDDLARMVEFYNEFRAGKVEVLPLHFFPQASIIEKSPDPAGIYKEIAEKGYAVSGCKGAHESKIIMAIGCSYVLPKKSVSFIIRNKLYRFSPRIRNFGHFNESVYYLSSLFKKQRSRNFLAFRQDELYKLRYLLFNKEMH